MIFKRGKRFFVVVLILVASFPILVKAQTDAVEIQQWDSLYDKAYDYLNTRPDSALRIGLDYLDWANSIKDSFEIAYANDLVGSSYYYTNQLEKSLIHHQQALSYFEALKDSFDINGVLINIGNVYSDQGHYIRAIKFYLRSIEIQQNLQDTAGQAITYSNIALIFYDQQDYDKSRQYAFKSIRLAQQSKLPDIESAGYNLLGELYLIRGQLDSALAYTYFGLELSKEHKLLLEEASAYGNFGLIAAKKGQYDQAVYYCKKAIDLATQYGDPYSIVLHYNGLTDAYLLNNQNEKALETAKLSYAKALMTSRSRFLLKETSLRLSQSHAAIGQYEDALKFQKEFALYSDTIDRLNIQEKILESDKQLKEKENSLLNTRITHEKQLTRNNQILLLISLSFLAIGVSFILLLIFHVQRSRKLNKDLKRKNEIILSNQKEIDDQKQALLSTNMELNDLIGTKDKLLSILTHDLKQPFNQLHYILELIDLNALDKKEGEFMITELKKSLRTTRETTENLLMWSKSQFGGFNIEQESVALKEIADQVMEQMRDLFRQAEVKLIVDDKDKGLHVFADREQLTIAIRNLVSNALKFSEKDDVVTIRIRESKEKALVEVIDTGKGMDQKQIDNLQNVDNVMITPGSISEKGTGLGVLIVNEFIHNNNGRLSISSELGKGSTFTISLPIMECDEDK